MLAEPWEEPVATEWPERILEDVQEHFARAETALLLCELRCMGGRWMEWSRGFILPKSWDPKSLMTGRADLAWVGHGPETT